MEKTAARRPRIVLFGGAGFIGRSASRALLAAGWQVALASRHPDRGGIENIITIQADITNSESITAALQGADAAVNLTGILSPQPRQGFDAVHHRGAEAVALAAKRQGISNFVHLSAIGADPASPSVYARSKAAGEQAVLAQLPGAVILRPSIVFGPGDGFFNRFGAMARFSPALPLIGGGNTLFQPVYVGDVAAAIVTAVQGKAKAGDIYELGGPERRSFADLLRYIGKVTGRARILLPLPFPLATGVATGIEAVNFISGGHMPAMLLITRDQVKLLRVDNVVSEGAVKEGRTLDGLGIAPQKIEAVVPGYLAER